MTSAPTYTAKASIPSTRTSLSVLIIVSVFGRVPKTEASAGRPQQLLKILSDCADASIVHLPSRALNDFDSAFGNLFPNIDTKGYAHQVSVLELHPWPFVPVVQ